ncbi:HAMP domain-containing sensor histidine kinase [Cellulomonas sp. GbtcB1]|uniref:sensor histidine kinase n=1 Tax=Cellulomonas sp. GbtcB1 TaxID=2824746 RepID=UPI0027E150BE|nr:HAMP domain-containing sensor histidine kinase [Cellulomonas sp. GbtcB1]
MTTTSEEHATSERPAGDAPTETGPAREGLADGVVRRVRDVWTRTPLLARLVGITTALLALGLSFAGAITTTSLSGFLVEQVDDRLRVQAETSREGLYKAYQDAGNSLDGVTLQSWGDRDFALAVRILGSSTTFTPQGTTLETEGSPRLPVVDLDALDHTTTTTVGSSERGATWRVAVAPMRLHGTTIGYVMYAEPLADVQKTVRQAAFLLWTSAVAILVIGAVVATWAVRRSLRGLREIEGTAAQIAAGDLSQRVPPAPETTEVGRLGAALNSMLAQIETAFDARTRSEERMRRFVADASHELRTPLAAIRGYGELYRMGALTEKDQVDDTMRRIEQSATRMGGLVEDLLALARLDSDRPGRTEPVDLAVLATDAAHDLRAIDPTREVRVGPLPDAAAPGPDGAPPTTVVPGDEARLRQVVANLVGNVARHTPAGTPAELGVGRVGDRVVLEVRDHGPGIAPEHAARVFERFYRVDASRTREGDGTGGGAGLGMAIVAAIVEAHHGDVAIAQTPGGGATIRVSLPATSGRPGGTAPTDQPEDHPVG